MAWILLLWWCMKRIFISLLGFVALFGLMAAPVQPSVLGTATSQGQAQPESKTFTGTILKSGEMFVLSDSDNKSRYMLDDQDKVRRYEGKHVKITGTVDVGSNTIHVETIEEIVARKGKTGNL
jgi:Protein of unknown function (DUF5818)